MPTTSVPPVPDTILPPPGTNWLATIDSAIVFLMICATMGAVMFVMLLALLFFSTSSARRKPIFVLNIVAILVGITSAVVIVYQQIVALKYPETPGNARVFFFEASINAYAPTFVDCILLVRLYAVFPLHSTPRLRFIFVIGVPALLNVGRLVNATVYLVNFGRIVFEHRREEIIVGGGGAVQIVSRHPTVKIECFLQIFDNLFSSALFLSRLRGHDSALRSRSQSFPEKVYTLFWISTCNFVFPVLLSIVQVVIYMVRPADYLIATNVQEANLYLTTIFLVFATVWVFEGRWVEERGLRAPGAVAARSPIRHATRPRHLSPREEGVVVIGRSLSEATMSQSLSDESTSTSQRFIDGASSSKEGREGVMLCTDHLYALSPKGA